jgi:menaquinol-cytochrome c reductase iron-sulfur subunit
MKSNNSPSDSGMDKNLLSRRQFLSTLSVLLGIFGASIVGIPIVGFIFSPLIKKVTQVWRAVGPVDSFKIGSTVHVAYEDSSPLPWAGVAAKSAAWLRRDGETEFTAFSVNCTHLGCPVRWLPDADLFMCPCHGGVYNNQGKVVAGPPPKSLYKYPVRINNGQVEILTSPIPIT